MKIIFSDVTSCERKRLIYEVDELIGIIEMTRIVSKCGMINFVAAIRKNC